MRSKLNCFDDRGKDLSWVQEQSSTQGSEPGKLDRLLSSPDEGLSVSCAKKKYFAFLEVAC